MTRSSELAAVSRLAVPLVGQQIGLQLMGAVDVALVGRYSPAALAGVGVANALIFEGLIGLDAKVEPVEEDPGSDAADDGERIILEDLSLIHI